VQQPAIGTVTVLPAEGPAGRPRLLFKQGKDKLEPGSELEVYYTVAVPGHPTPSPATALLLGSGVYRSLSTAFAVPQTLDCHCHCACPACSSSVIEERDECRK
jgi:hypothetical protein